MPRPAWKREREASNHAMGGAGLEPAASTV
jgi:hypothetical protein